MLVEIWSDVVCPWCAIGKARFEKALAEVDFADEVQVVWRSFQLDPDAANTGEGDNVARLAAKYGTSIDQARQMVDRVEALAADEGLAFDLVHARAANTFDAHRLLHEARDHGVQHAVTDAFLQAAHVDRAHVGDPDTLRARAVAAGLPAGAVEDVLESDRHAEAVRADQQEAHALGCSGVPFFVLDRRFAIPGAQPVEVMRDALQRAHVAAGSLESVTADATAGDGHVHDDSCADGACRI